MLPGTDGIDVMKNTPAMADLPVIFLSGYTKDDTIARALDAGAEDYITKPFSSTELMARIRAALRKRSKPGSFVLGNLTVDYGTQQVTESGHTVQLTATEYKVLYVLSLRNGEVVTFDSLIRQVWTNQVYANRGLVRTVIMRIRRKLGDTAEQPKYIMSVYGDGYRMVEPGILQRKQA